MNMHKLIILSVFGGSFVGMVHAQAPVAEFYVAAQALPVVEHINQNNVEAARQAYEEEVALAWPVWTGVATGAIVAACLGYQAYKYWNSFDVTPTIETLSRDLMEVKQRSLINSHNVDSLARGMQLEAPQSAWYYRTSMGLWNASTSLLYSGVASAFVVSPVVNKLLEIKRMLPNSGDLKWYLAERTGYNRNIVDLSSNSETFPATFKTVLQLFVSDIEKVLGYMEHFKHNVHSALNKTRSENFCTDIMWMTNLLVESANRGDSMELLKEQLIKINLAVASAQHFVAQNS